MKRQTTPLPRFKRWTAPSQPSIALGVCLTGQTHDYQRHLTTSLFAALDLLEGTGIAECQPRRRHQEFLPFLDRIDQSVDPA